jgi:FHA domain-containing protein
MNLVLRALTLNDQPLSQAIVGCFDVKGGTIGRSDTNTMTLPDPERHISRLQAEVIAQEGEFHVRNAASANAIFINGRALGPGERGVLASHDELRIGGYVLGVLIEAENEVVRTITQGRAVVDARAVIVNSAVEHRTDPRQMAKGRDASAAAPLSQPPLPPLPSPAPPPRATPPAPAAASNPFADLLTPGPAVGGSAPNPNDPFAGLLGTPAPQASSRADPFAFLNVPAPAPAGSPSPAPPSGAPARLPDDFDPFANLAPAPAPNAPAAAPRVGANDLLGSVGASSGTPASIDTSFGLGPASSSAADPLAGFLSPAPSSPGSAMAGSGVASTDPFAMFGTPPAAPGAGPAAHAAFNHTPELKAAYQPPQVAAPRPAAQAAAPSVDLPLDTPAAPAASAAPAAPSVDQLFAGLGLGSGGASADPLADFLGAKPSSVPAPAAPAPTPPTARTPPAPAVAALRAVPDHPATTPAVRPLAAPVPATMAGVSAGAAAGVDPLWAAFSEGAGIRVDLPQGLNPDQMRVIGKVLREATEGALRMMAVRATAKTELRAAVTTIRARNNNPLKFSPNAQAALEQLLQPPLRGFMAGPLAMQDAMHDLVGHSIGTMAGMRAALAGVLSRFEPGELERKLVGKSMMDSLLPMNRKAKLWDLYLQHFGSIRDDAQDDFHNLFGAAFVAAYEDQLDRLASPGDNSSA